MLRGVGVDRDIGHFSTGETLWNRLSTPNTTRRHTEVTKGSQTCQTQDSKPTFDMVRPSIQTLTLVFYFPCPYQNPSSTATQAGVCPSQKSTSGMRSQPISAPLQAVLRQSERHSTHLEFSPLLIGELLFLKPGILHLRGMRKEIPHSLMRVRPHLANDA